MNLLNGGLIQTALYFAAELEAVLVDSVRCVSYSIIVLCAPHGAFSQWVYMEGGRERSSVIANTE